MEGTRGQRNEVGWEKEEKGRRSTLAGVVGWSCEWWTDPLLGAAWSLKSGRGIGAGTGQRARSAAQWEFTLLRLIHVSVLPCTWTAPSLARHSSLNKERERKKKQTNKKAPMKGPLVCVESCTQPANGNLRTS